MQNKNLLKKKKIYLYILSDEWDTKKYFITYTIIFFFLIPFVFLSFINNSKGFCWLTDAAPEHIVNLRYVGIYLRNIILSCLKNGNLKIPLYDFSIGLGDGIVERLSHYYFEPITIIPAIFTPEKGSEYLYIALILLRFYISGITFSMYCLFWKKCNIYTLCGTFVYVFNGFTLFAGIRHPHYLSPVIYLPILFLGIEKILKKESPKVFVIATFISAITSYYFFYINTILMVVYSIVRSMDYHQKDYIKHIFLDGIRIFLFYLLGCGLAGFLFFPAALSNINSGRSGTTTITSESLLYYAPHYLKKLFSYIITPSKAPGFWVHLGYVSITYLVLLEMFLTKRNKGTYFKVFFCILSMCLSFPFFGLIFSGLSTTTNRWSYVCAIFAAYSMVYFLPDFEQINNRKVQLLFLGVISYICIIVMNKNVRNIYSFVGAIFLLITFIIVILNQKNKAFLRISLFICIIINISVNAMFTYNEDLGGYVKAFNNLGEMHNYVQNSNDRSIKKIKDSSFYRVEKSAFDRKRLNGGMWWKYNNNSTVNSVINRNIVDFYLETENPALRQLGIYQGTDGRTISSTLQCVKYYIQSTNEKENFNIPYGYSLYKQLERDKVKDNIFINDNALPLGYCYSNFITKSTFDKLNVAQKQEVLTKAIVINDTDINYLNEQQLLSTPSLDSKKLSFEIIQTKKLSWNKNSLKVDQPKASITIQFFAEPDSEIYLRLKNLDINSLGARNLLVTFKTNGNQKSYSFGTDSYTYTTFAKNHTINLGYGFEGLSTCEVIFGDEGNFLLDDIEVYSLSLNNYVSDIKKLKDNILEDIVISPNQIQGTINITSEKILCFSIPHSAGWELKIDGKKVSLLNGNLMFMATPISPGVHNIELTFITPGLRLGIFITIISSLIFTIFLFMERKHNQQKRSI